MDEKLYKNNLISTFFPTLSNDMMKEIRNQYLYVRNDYLMEFCWWYNIKDARLIKTELKECDKIGTKDLEFKRFEISQFSYLDKFWCLWEIFKSYEKIFVRNKDICLRKVTIDPFENRVKLNLLEHESEGIEKLQYSKIFAYSFGPFDPKYFFNEDTFRIIWLLKEPLLCGIEEINKRKSGVDQASIYNKWEVIVKEMQDDGTKTKYNLIKRSQTILKEIAKLTAEEIDGILDTKLKKQLYKLKGEDLNSEDVIMKHICILEVNHFPGLALTGKDSDDNKINEWAGINYELIERFISFYNPKIVIAGGTLEHFLPSNEKGEFSLVKTFIKFDNKSLKIFNDPIIEWMYINAGGRFEDSLPKDKEVKRPSLIINEKYTNDVNASKHPNDTSHMLKFNFGRNAKYLSKNNERIYIQAYHPSMNSNYPLTWAEKDGERIKEWLKRKD